MECRAIFCRLMAIRLRRQPKNITIIQVYAHTSSNDDEIFENFYSEFEDVVKKNTKERC